MVWDSLELYSFCFLFSFLTAWGFDYNDKLANTAQAAFNFNLTKQFFDVANYKVKNIVSVNLFFIPNMVSNTY